MSKPVMIRIGGKFERLTQEEFVYRYLKANGPATVMDISRGTCIPYTTVYDIITRLSKEEPPRVKCIGRRAQGRGKKPYIWEVIEDGTD